jgi:hypothetical protein
MNTNKEPLVLQAGKTYVTKEGQNITVERSTNYVLNSRAFVGSNNVYYSATGCADPLSHFNSRRLDISHELTEQTEDWHYSPCDECCNDCDECEDYLDEPQVQLIDKFKFKQNTNGTKRKLILKDYSDRTVEFIFKQKDGGMYETTGGFRLSYEAVLMLYNSLEFLLEGQGRDPLEMN